MRSEFIVTSCSLGKLRYTVLISALCVDNRMSDNDFLLTAYLSVVDVILSVTLRPGRRNVAWERRHSVSAIVVWPARCSTWFPLTSRDPNKMKSHCCDRQSVCGPTQMPNEVPGRQTNRIWLCLCGEQACTDLWLADLQTYNRRTALTGHSVRADLPSYCLTSNTK